MHVTTMLSDKYLALEPLTPFHWPMIQNIKRDPFEQNVTPNDTKSLLAFGGTLEASTIASLIFWGYSFKVIYEVVMTPLTYLIVNFLKRREGIDTFDYGTDFNPLPGEARQARHRPGVALLDVTMPGVSGIDLLRELHATRAAVRVVLLTACIEHEQVLEGDLFEARPVLGGRSAPGPARRRSC